MHYLSIGVIFVIMANTDIVELKNSIGVIVYPKTVGEAVYLENEEDLQTFLDALHEALAYNIYPKENEGVSLGKEGKSFNNIYAKKIVVAVLDASEGSINAGSISANTISATTITGNVNSAGEADKGSAGRKVYGAVAN